MLTSNGVSHIWGMHSERDDPQTALCMLSPNLDAHYDVAQPRSPRAVPSAGRSTDHNLLFFVGSAPGCVLNYISWLATHVVAGAFLGRVGSIGVQTTHVCVYVLEHARNESTIPMQSRHALHTHTLDNLRS